MLRIESRAWADMIGQVQRDFPLESCGLFWADPDRVVRRYEPYPGPLFLSRFSFDDRWLLRAYVQGYQAGFTVAGVCHSHPQGGSLRPSCEDVRGHPLGTIGVIVDPRSLRFRAFRFGSRDDFPQEVDVSIVETLEGLKGFSKGKA